MPEERLSLRIDPKLKEWFDQYTRQKQTSMTQVLLKHIQELQRNEREWWEDEDGPAD